jgi:hypothetical protein
MTPPTAIAPTAKMTMTTTMTIFSQGLEDFATAVDDATAGSGAGEDGAGDATG